MIENMYIYIIFQALEKSHDMISLPSNPENNYCPPNSQVKASLLKILKMAVSPLAVKVQSSHRAGGWNDC